MRRDTRREWRKRLLYVALAVGTASACSSAAETITEQPATTAVGPPIDAAVPVIDDDYVGTGPTVAVIGDSITQQSGGAIHEALSSFSVRIASRIGSTIGVLQPVAEELAATNPDIVVVNLGTNDVWWQLPLGSAAADYQAIIDLFPASCTVAVTVTEHGTPAWHPYQPTYNQALAAAFNDAIRGRADRVADWEAAIAPDPARYTGDDRIHPNEEGQRLLGRLIEDAVSECET